MEVKIEVPEGYVLRRTETGYSLIPKEMIEPIIDGYYITNEGTISEVKGIIDYDKILYGNLFAERKQALAALAFAQLSIIIKYDERFGGPITDEEWTNQKVDKYSIGRYGKTSMYSFLSFHTYEQRDLFYKENKKLIDQYFMIDEKGEK